MKRIARKIKNKWNPKMDAEVFKKVIYFPMKRKEKEQKKQYRKDNSPGGGLENMIAYVDKFGNITSEPPVEEPVAKKDS